MKAINLNILRPLILLIGLLVSAITGLAQTVTAPEINSPLVASATVGEPFVYTITTTADNALTYGTSSNLPDGLTRTGPIISGVPLVAGEFTIRLDAANEGGSAIAQNLVLTITNPAPVINSILQASGRVGQFFTYTISASNSPDIYSAIGLPDGLDVNATTGIISGTPTEDLDGDVIIKARNTAGEGMALLRLNILPALSAPSQPTVSVSSPPSGLIVEGNSSQITVIAEVTPQPGQEIDVVFVRWTNPAAPLTEIIVADMISIATDAATGAITYTADVTLGFNPNDREVGGGSIDLEVVAYQTNAAVSSDAGIDTVNIRVKPILEFLFPEEAYAMDAVEIGDIFASVRLSTNDFTSVTARIAGSSTLETVSLTTSNPNGVYNFTALARIDFPGFYDIRVTAVDGAGYTTVIERRIQISDSLAEPVAVVTSPTPGFTNEVFTPAILSYVETDRQTVVSAGVVVGYDVTYELRLISGGQGYYPRNTVSTILATNDDLITLGVPNVDVSNGRVTDLPQLFTTFYLLADSEAGLEWGTSGNALMDDLSDPGYNGQIAVAAQFFKANADLVSYQIFVNGEDVTPGTGNLVPPAVPGGGDPGVDVSVIRYPAVGSPNPGDYIAYARVVDAQGEVGTSEPLSFSILPFEPLEITLSREGAGDVQQGTSLAFFVDIEPISSIETVEFFDSESGDSLGFASSVTAADGQTRYRFTRAFNSQGEFGLFTVATAFNGQTAISDPIRVTVTPINDLTVTLTSPTANRALFRGQSLTFAAEADATPGVASVQWVVNNEVLADETDMVEPYEYSRLFDVVGSYRVLARATDNFGNIKDSSEVIVTVSASDLSISITNPLVDQLLVQGESLILTAAASATLGVDRVEWSVDGEIVEIDSASPYSLSYDFTNVGSSSVFARAYDSLDNTASSASITVQVDSPNPLLRDEDFVASIYASLIGRAPTNDQRAAALAALDGTLTSRSQFVADLLQSDALQTTSIVQLIHRTMTGEWADASALEAGRDVLTNGGTGALDANSLTAFLIPEYESRFAVLNTQSGFVQQLYRNKHGTQPNAQSQVRLYNSATGASVTLSNQQVIPGYSGDLVSYATQFALDNDLSNFIGPDGLPLSSLHLYSYPNNPEADSLLSALISALWGIEPTDAEINSLSGLSLTGAVETVLTDSRYYNQFPSTSPDGGIAQIMATFGVFDLSKNGPDDDADGDGVTNLEEIALGSDPLDAADMVEPMTASVDGTDFVVTFIKLADTSTLGGLDFTIECSPTMAVGSWMDADPSATQNLAADQSGVPTGYERIEFRIDMTTQDCTFVRVVVD